MHITLQQNERIHTQEKLSMHINCEETTRPPSALFKYTTQIEPFPLTKLLLLCLTTQTKNPKPHTSMAKHDHTLPRSHLPPLTIMLPLTQMRIKTLPIRRKPMQDAHAILVRTSTSHIISPPQHFFPIFHHPSTPIPYHFSNLPHPNYYLTQNVLLTYLCDNAGH
jgi:hypothetical protein